MQVGHFEPPSHGQFRLSRPTAEIMRTAVTPRVSWQVPDPLAVSQAGLHTASATLNEHAQTELSLEGDAARYRRPAEGQLPKTRQRLLLLQIQVHVAGLRYESLAG